MKQNVITNVEPVIRKALILTGRQVTIIFNNFFLFKEFSISYFIDILVATFT
jgi:hypothetical protein